MKTYYCVTSSFDDRGRATANITDMIKAEEKPESTYTSTRRKDIYNDWFESEKEKYPEFINLFLYLMKTDEREYI
mgnify:CR=1 FL=1